MDSEVTGIGDKGSHAARNLQMITKIQFPDGCPLSSIEDRVRDVEIQRDVDDCKVDFLVDLNQGAGEYQVEHRSVTDRPGGSHVASCVCEVFHEHDCLPHVLDVTDNTVVIATYPPTQEDASELLAGLQDAGNSVEFLRFHSSDGKDHDHFKEVNLSQLSRKQREAIERATASGFFEPGSDTKLQELGNEIGITASAYSQRLSRAQNEIFRQLFGH